MSEKSNDEKLTENINGIVDGAARVIDGLGRLFGRDKSATPKPKDSDTMGRRERDKGHDDDDDIGPTQTTGAVVKTGIVDDKLVLQICEQDGKVIKQVRLSVEEAEAHVKDVQKKLRAIKDD